MDKIYEMINRNSGASIKCSDKYLIQWVSRGYEVESFILEESSKEEVRSVTSKSVEGFPFLSSNHVEYNTDNKATDQEAVNEVMEFYRRKSI